MEEVLCEQRSEQWHELRRGRITASQFSVMMSGLGTKGFKDLISEKAAEIMGAEIEEGYQSEDMLRGVELEDEAAEEYPAEVEKSGFVTLREGDELYEWVGCSPDRWVGEDGILEVKCPKMKTHWGYIMNGVEVNDYKWQIQGQLWITGRKWCDFMSYYPNLKPFIIRVYPDEVMINELRSRALYCKERILEEIKCYEVYNYDDINI